MAKQKEAQVRQCEECSAQFRDRRNRGQRFCSRSCSAKASYRRRRKSGDLPRKRTGKYVECELQSCNERFYAKKYQLESDRHLFCSHECSTEWQRSELVTLTCETCGAEFDVKPSRAEARFCSRGCYYARDLENAIDRTHNGRPVTKWASGYLYVWEPEHPKAENYGGWVAEHTLVAEKKLGRSLKDEEEVHHINGVKDDNRPENIAVLPADVHRQVSQKLRRRRSLKRKLDRVTNELVELEAQFGPLGLEKRKD